MDGPNASAMVKWKQPVIHVATLLLVLGLSVLATWWVDVPGKRLERCRKNLENISTAFLVYSIDHGGRYPLPKYGEPFCGALGDLPSEFRDHYLRHWYAPQPGDCEYLFMGSPDEYDFYVVVCPGGNHRDAGRAADPLLYCERGCYFRDDAWDPCDRCRTQLKTYHLESR